MENLINGTNASRNFAVSSVEDKSLENKALKIFNLMTDHYWWYDEFTLADEICEYAQKNKTDAISAYIEVCKVEGELKALLKIYKTMLRHGYDYSYKGIYFKNANVVNMFRNGYRIEYVVSAHHKDYDGFYNVDTDYDFLFDADGNFITKEIDYHEDDDLIYF